MLIIYLSALDTQEDKDRFTVIYECCKEQMYRTALGFLKIEYVVLGDAGYTYVKTNSATKTFARASGRRFLMIEEEEGEYAIFVTDLRIVIPALKLELREGYCGQWQEDEEYYMADFSLTAVYEEGADAEKFLMWEQDSPLVTLYNFTHKPMEELEQLECILTTDC